MSKIKHHLWIPSQRLLIISGQSLTIYCNYAPCPRRYFAYAALLFTF